VGLGQWAADFVHACRVQREWAAKNPRAPFKAPITIIIVSLGLVRFRRAAAPMEAKIRSHREPCNCHTRIVFLWDRYL